MHSLMCSRYELHRREQTGAQKVRAAEDELARVRAAAQGDREALVRHAEQIQNDSFELSRQLERAARLWGTYPDFSYYLGRLNLDAGDLAGARVNFAEAAASGEHPDAAYYLGLSLERSAAGVPAQPAQAAEAYRQALALRPSFPEAREGLERLGQPLP